MNDYKIKTNCFISVLFIYQQQSNDNFEFYIDKQKNLTKTGSCSCFREENVYFKPENRFLSKSLYTLKKTVIIALSLLWFLANGLLFIYTSFKELIAWSSYSIMYALTDHADIAKPVHSPDHEEIKQGKLNKLTKCKVKPPWNGIKAKKSLTFPNMFVWSEATW